MSTIIGNECQSFSKLWQFYEHRAVGRFVGLAFFAIGSTGIMVLLKPWSWFLSPENFKPNVLKPWKILPALVSMAAVFSGFKLRTKKYYNDPVALREYVKIYHNSSFIDAFSNFDSWEGISRSTFFVHHHTFVSTLSR